MTFRKRTVAGAITAVACLLAGSEQTSVAQTPATPAKTVARPAAGGMHADANLAQMMKGIFFTSSNVVFAAQSTDPAKVAPAKDPAVATDPMTNAYGKWEAVENAGLAIADGANLLMVSGRKCSNGLPVPMAKADWPKLVAGVREAGLKVYAAAKAKDQDKILDAADAMTTACSNCHDKYREKPTVADRCK